MRAPWPPFVCLIAKTSHDTAPRCAGPVGPVELCDGDGDGAKECSLRQTRDEHRVQTAIFDKN